MSTDDSYLPDLFSQHDCPYKRRCDNYATKLECHSHSHVLCKEFLHTYNSQINRNRRALGLEDISEGEE